MVEQNNNEGLESFIRHLDSIELSHEPFAYVINGKTVLRRPLTDEESELLFNDFDGDQLNHNLMVNSEGDVVGKNGLKVSFVEQPDVWQGIDLNRQPSLERNKEFKITAIEENIVTEEQTKINDENITVDTDTSKGEETTFKVTPRPYIDPQEHKKRQEEKFAHVVAKQQWKGLAELKDKIEFKEVEKPKQKHNHNKSKPFVKKQEVEVNEKRSFQPKPGSGKSKNASLSGSQVSPKNPHTKKSGPVTFK